MKSSIDVLGVAAILLFVAPVVSHGAKTSLPSSRSVDPVLAGVEPGGYKLLPEAATVVELGEDDVRLSHMGPDGSTAWGTTEWCFTDAAFSTANHEYLVVWSGDDDLGTTVVGEMEILGQRVTAATGQPVGATIRISFMGPDGSTAYTGWEPAVAYNSTADEYLVVWSGDHDADPLVDNEFEIWGQRVDAASGALVGDNFRISQMGPDGYEDYDAYAPDVAYSSVRNLYQVVWEGDDIVDGMVDNEYEIFGQKVNFDGSLLEAGERLSRMGPGGDPSYDAADPAVCWASDTNQFLVVFTGFTTILGSDEQEIFGELVAGVPSGGHVVSNFRISWMGPAGDTASRGELAAVAHNPRQHRFLVVWRGDTTVAPFVDGDFEIWGRSLGNDGSLVDPQRVFSQVGPSGDPEFTVFEPRVEYDRGSNSFFTVWAGSTPVDSLEYEIWGHAIAGVPGPHDPVTAQRLSSMGPDGDVAYIAFFTGLAIDPSTGRALVVWWGSDDVDGMASGEFEIFGQLAAASVLFSDDFEGGSTGEWDGASP